MSTIDYGQIVEAYKYLPEPTRLFKLDRTAVLAAHADLNEREQTLDATGQVRTRRVIVGGGKHFSKLGIEELKPFTLFDDEIRIDEIAKGRLLVCQNIASPIRTASVQLVVEDSKGCVVPVSLFRIPSKFSSQELAEIYPIGSCFIIKEPFFRSNRDGYYVRIESPSDFVRIYPDSTLLRSLPGDFTSKHNLSRRSVEDCKSIGNKAFQAQRWHAAREAYTWSLSLLSTLSQTTLQATILSNLALTNLRLSLPSSARRNCLSALQLFPPPVYTSPSTPLERKLLYRLSLSLYSLDDFEQCISILSSLTTSDPDSADLLKRAQSRLLEQTQAAYDFPSLYRQARKNDNLDVANYFAKDLIEVKDIEGKGKGVVARRRIDRGELLVVYKPVASAGHKERSNAEAIGKRTQYLTGVNLWTKSEDPWTVNEVISQLAWDVAEGEEGAERATKELWAGDELGRAGTTGDVSRLEGIVTFNGFKIEDLTSFDIDSDSTKQASDASPPTALYPSLPSALNHSCIANSSYSFLSNLFVLRARTDIEEGEEVTISYVDQRTSLEEREEKLGKHGFICLCALCERDRKNGVATRKKREALRDKAEGASSVEELVKLKNEMEKTYADSPSELSRPSHYSITRLLSQAYASRGRHRESIAVEKEGLASLGTVFEETEEGKVRLVSPPVMGDTDAVLSSLWISKMWEALGEKTKSSAWEKFARELERGQAGEELFDLRYLSKTE